MRQCKDCGSFAINPEHGGRDKKSDLDLCDVCYWRLRCDIAKSALERVSLSSPPTGPFCAGSEPMKMVEKALNKLNGKGSK